MFSSLFDILVSVLLYIIMDLFGLKSTSLIVVLAIFHLLFVFFILYLSAPLATAFENLNVPSLTGDTKLCKGGLCVHSSNFQDSFWPQLGTTKR